MLKNFISTTFRSIKKNPSFTVINVLGLSVGIAAFVLISVFVRDELTYDKFHKNHERIYRGMTFYERGFVMGVPDKLIDLMKQDLPELESIARLDFGGNIVMEYNGEKVFESEAYKADPEVFEVFDFSLKYGNEEDALTAQNSVIISSYMALKYFGKEDVIGEVFKSVNDEKGKIITGVLNEIPGNSRFQFNVLRPFPEKELNPKRPWEASGLMYFLLNKPVDDKAFTARLMSIAEDNGYDQKGTEFTIENYGQLYLNSKWSFTASGVSGNMEFIYIFSAVGILLLLLACINYVNSATAKSLLRLKEVGVRKVVGASKRQIIGQFLLETGFFVFLAVIIGAGLAEYFLPTVNELADKSLSLDYFSDAFILSFLILLIPVITFLAGLYPAFFISRFKTLRILKGEVAGGKSVLRKSLVVFQLVTTLMLLFGTQIITKQVDFFLDSDVGIEADGIASSFFPREKPYEVIKKIVEDVPGVAAVTSSPLPGVFSNAMPLEWKQDNEDKEMKMYLIPAAMNVVQTLGIELISGRDFIEDSQEDKNSSILIGQEVATALGFENPIGEQVKVYNDEFKMMSRTIIGVYKDPHFNLKRKPLQTVIVPTERFLSTINIKLDDSNRAETMLRITEAWNEVEPNKPFEYTFMQDRIEANYSKEKKFGEIIQYFSWIAILIASLGLFGLSVFTIVQKYKEIGIRKVLGASVVGITYRFLKSYLVLILIASLVAIPLAYFIMDGWLADFANRIQMGVSVFAVGIGISVIVVIVTVGYQSIKAALSNPVKILRDE